MTQTVMIDRALLERIQWVEYSDPDWGLLEFCPECRSDRQYGHDESCALREALQAAPVQQEKGLFIDLIAQHPGLAEELKAIDPLARVSELGQLIQPDGFDAPVQQAQDSQEAAGMCCCGGLRPKSSCASCSAWKPSPPPQPSESKAVELLREIKPIMHPSWYPQIDAVLSAQQV